MEVIVIDNYIHLTKLGTKITAIAINHDAVWKDLPFDSTTYTLDETNPLSIELRQWEANNYPILKSPNWQELASALRGTEVFGKVYAATELSNLILRDFNLLTATLNSAHPSLADLEFALIAIKIEMGEKLSTDDYQFVNSVLSDNYFPITI